VDADKRSFDDFFAAWQQENVRPLKGPGMDPSDRRYLIQRRTQRLIEEARERGLYSGLLDAARGYKTVEQFIESLFDSAELRARL